MKYYYLFAAAAILLPIGSSINAEAQYHDSLTYFVDSQPQSVVIDGKNVSETPDGQTVERIKRFHDSGDPRNLIPYFLFSSAVSSGNETEMALTLACLKSLQSAIDRCYELARKEGCGIDGERVVAEWSFINNSFTTDLKEAFTLSGYSFDAEASCQVSIGCTIYSVPSDSSPQRIRDPLYDGEPEDLDNFYRPSNQIPILIGPFG